MRKLNDTVWATLGVSKIHGIGVIAIRDIPKGTEITDYHIGDEAGIYEITPFMFEKILPEIQKLILDRMNYPKGIELIKFISPNAQQHLQSFMNHSENPNTNGLVALKDIKKGEELTENYHLFYPEGLSDLNINNFPALKS